jgi:hypothetical protein
MSDKKKTKDVTVDETQKRTQVRVVPDLGNRFDSTNLIPKNISTSP